MVQVLIKPSRTNEWMCGSLLRVGELRITQVRIAGQVQTCDPSDIAVAQEPAFSSGQSWGCYRIPLRSLNTVVSTYLR